MILSGKNKIPRQKKAQAMVEFALIIPILLLVIVGLIEYGRLFYAWLIIENSTRFGIRYATAGSYDPGYCADDTPCTADNKAAEIKTARLPSIQDETRRVILGFAYDEDISQPENQYLNITVCAGPEDESAADPIGEYFTRPQMGSLTKYAECTDAGGGDTGSAGDPGDLVVVAADYNFTFIVLPLFGVRPDMIHLASYRIGRNESFETAQIVDFPPPDPGGDGSGPVYKSPTPTLTPSHTATYTFTPSNTPTRTPSRTPTTTFTPTVSRTPTITLTPTISKTPTKTLTPSHTPTPTNTPLPSCSLIGVNRAARFNGNNIDVRIQNDNVATAYLISSTLTWNPSPLTGGKYMDYASWAGTPYYNPGGTSGAGITISSQNTTAASGTLPLAGNGTRAVWLAASNNSTWSGTWTITLVFDFPGWGTCPETSSVNNFTATPSITPSRTPTVPTNTPTRTRTPTATVPTRTPTRTLSPTPTVPTNTPTKTLSPTPTVPTNTPTRTKSPTPTVPSNTPTKTKTPTPTVITPTPTKTPTPTFTPSPTYTPDNND